MKLFKINTSFFVYVNANDEHEAEKIVTDALQPLVDESEDYEQTDFHIEEVPEDERNIDYRYEIFDKSGQLINGGDGYCDLDTAIEYALENGGEYIKEVYYYLGVDGLIDADDFGSISSREMWRKE